MAISNKNEPIICDWGFHGGEKKDSRIDSSNNYLELPPFIHSFIHQMVSIFYYMLGSILLYIPVGMTRESVRIKTGQNKNKKKTCSLLELVFSLFSF